MKPAVSVIVLNWNGWRDTIQCLESTLRNDYGNCQVTVIDNGSLDGSMDHIKAWAEGKLKMSANPDDSLGNSSQPSIHKPIPHVYYTRDEAEQGGDPERERELKQNIRSNGTIATRYPLALVQVESNLGFAGGNNIGIKYALKQNFDYILVLNNDAFPAENTISQMVNFMDKTPSAGACGVRLFYADGLPQPSYGCFPTIPRMVVHLFPLYKLCPQKWFRGFKRLSITPSEQLKEPMKVDYPSGACLMVRREVINAIGVMDDQFFMYFDETDWCYRMKQAGWDRYYVPKAEVVHRCGGSFQNVSLKQSICNLESRLKFFGKHFSPATVFVLRVLHLTSSVFFLALWEVGCRVGSSKWRKFGREKVHYFSKVFHLSIRIGCPLKDSESA